MTQQLLYDELHEGPVAPFWALIKSCSCHVPSACRAPWSSLCQSYHLPPPVIKSLWSSGSGWPQRVEGDTAVFVKALGLAVSPAVLERSTAGGGRMLGHAILEGAVGLCPR